MKTIEKRTLCSKKKQTGLATVEYAILLGMIGVFSMAAVTTLGTKTKSVFSAASVGWGVSSLSVPVSGFPHSGVSSGAKRTDSSGVTWTASSGGSEWTSGSGSSEVTYKWSNSQNKFVLDN